MFCVSCINIFWLIRFCKSSKYFVLRNNVFGTTARYVEFGRAAVSHFKYNKIFVMNYVTVILIVDSFANVKFYSSLMYMCLQTLHLYHSFFVSGFHWVNKNSCAFNCSGRKAVLWMPMFSRNLWSNNFTEGPKCSRLLLS